MELQTKKLGDNSIELEEHNNSEYPLFHEFPFSLIDQNFELYFSI